jgi:hypothetical protein
MSKKLSPTHDLKEVIESGLSTGKRTQYAGPGTDTVMPQVTALECAVAADWKPEGPARGIKAGIPPRPGLQWNASSHRWFKPNVGVSALAQHAGVAFKPAPQTSHAYQGAGIMPVREDASERTKFHALAHVLDQKYRISRQMDEDNEELQVEQHRLEQEIRVRGEAGVDSASAEEHLAEAFGRWMTDPEFEETFPAMVEFMHDHLMGVLDLKKGYESVMVQREGKTFASHRWKAEDQEYATREQCGTFALALHDWLKSQGKDAQIVLLGSDPTWGTEVATRYPSGGMRHDYFNHVAIKVGAFLYDVTGRHTVQQLADAYDANGVIPISSDALRKHMGASDRKPLFFDRAFYDQVQRDLKKEVAPPVFPSQPAHSQGGQPAGEVLMVPEVRPEQKQKRPAIAVPVQQLKRI